METLAQCCGQIGKIDASTSLLSLISDPLFKLNRFGRTMDAPIRNVERKRLLCDIILIIRTKLRANLSLGSQDILNMFYCIILPAKSRSDVMFCLQSYGTYLS